MSDRTPMDRYLDRLERLLIKCDEADRAERRERRRSGRTLEQEIMENYERQNSRRANSSEDEPKH